MSVWAGDAPTADVWHVTERIARKEHQCCACGYTIAPGHRYEITTSIYEGHVTRWKRCLRCAAIFDHLSDKCNKEGGDDVPEMALDCGHEYFDRWREHPPAEVAELAFLLPGELPGSLLTASEVTP